MPEHVHLLVNEPQKDSLATAIQVLKQTTSKALKHADDTQFWQRRYYDFNVWTHEKRIEKLRYVHRNPVKRGLVEKPEDWLWSSFRHYATGVKGTVEIESFWTTHMREQTIGRLESFDIPHLTRYDRAKDGHSANFESIRRNFRYGSS
jgi:putative transposase